MLGQDRYGIAGQKQFMKLYLHFHLKEMRSLMKELLLKTLSLVDWVFLRRLL
jgi:hypothetical protein